VLSWASEEVIEKVRNRMSSRISAVAILRRRVSKDCLKVVGDAISGHFKASA